MSDHDKWSPSARPRWGVCAASLREEAKYPDQQAGAAAVDGTHTHTVASTAITLGMRGADMVGMTLTDHDGTFMVEADRAERVDFLLDYIASRKASVVMPERKVDPEPLIGRKGAGGTADVTLIGDTWLEIVDLKDGMNPVSASSPQLNSYGWGVLAGGGIPATLETIRLTIVQPKLRMKGMSGIDTVEMSIAEFLSTKQAFIDQIDATLAENPAYTPGEACKYCRASGKCRAQTEQAFAASGISFADLSQTAADKNPNAMTDDEIRTMIEAAPLIRSMLESVEKEALSRFELGKPIAGLKTVRGRGTRSWDGEDAVIAEKLKKMGMPKGTIWRETLISPAQVEKAAWEKRDGTKESLSPRQLKTVGTLIKKSDGKLVVVSESDSRTAVTIAPAGMFVPVVADLPPFLN